MSDLIETLELMCEQNEIQAVPRSFLVDLRGEIERLTTEASCAAHNAAEYHDIIRGQRKRIAKLEAALRYIQIDSDEIIIVAAQTISKYAREALANSEVDTTSVDGYCGKRSSKAGLQAGEEESDD